MNHNIAMLAQRPGNAEVLAILRRQTGPGYLCHADDDYWERWTDMRFKESGDNLVDGAQNPVITDKRM